MTRLQISILLVGQRHGSGSRHLLLVLCHELAVDSDLRRSKSRSSNEFLSRRLAEIAITRLHRRKTHQGGVADQLAGEPQEGLLEVVVGLGRDIVVLQVLLAVESDGLGLHLALLNIDLVTAENDGDVLADTDEIACFVMISIAITLYVKLTVTYGASWGRSCT